MKNRVRSALICALVAVALVGSGSMVPAGAQAKKSPVKIGFVCELSGVLGAVTLCRSSLSGLQTSVKILNDGGGIAGHPIEINIYDGQSNPAATSTVMRQAIADKVVATTGFLLSADLSAQVPLFQSSKLPYLATGYLFAPYDTMSNAFSPTPSNKATGAMLVTALKQRLGSLKGKNIAFAGASPSVPVDEAIAGFKAVLKKEGGNLARTIRDPSTVNSWSSQAASVVSSNIDAVVIHHSESGDLVMGKALTVAGFRGPIISQAVASSDVTFAGLGLTNFYAQRESEGPEPGTALYKAVLAAKASTTRAQAQPTYFSRGYFNGFAIAAALKKCGVPCEWPKFSTSLRSLGVVSVPNNPFYGPIDFSKTNSGLSASQLFRYDPATKRGVKIGAPLN